MEEINHIHLPTTRTGRIATLGEPGEKTRHVWILLHGYRQLATSFIKKFSPWAGEDRWILAPEGLSRFYVEGFTGRVGASWMTREDRLHEIEDQKVWLDSVMSWIGAEVDLNQCQLHFLAFSQGVATLWRWLASSSLMPHSLVFFAGKIPEEFEEKMDRELEKSRILFVYGNEDQFLTPERVEAEMKILEAHMPHAEVLKFKGKHDIGPEALTLIGDRIMPA